MLYIILHSYHTQRLSLFIRISSANEALPAASVTRHLEEHLGPKLVAKCGRQKSSCCCRRRIWCWAVWDPQKTHTHTGPQRLKRSDIEDFTTRTNLKAVRQISAKLKGIYPIFMDCACRHHMWHVEVNATSPTPRQVPFRSGWKDVESLHQISFSNFKSHRPSTTWWISWDFRQLSPPYGRVGVDKRQHDCRVAGQLEPKWQTSHLLLSHRKPVVFFHDITCGMWRWMPPAQPHGKYLFEVVGRMSNPCIKFHFQISNLTDPAPHDGSAGISVSFLHLLASALTVCI